MKNADIRKAVVWGVLFSIIAALLILSVGAVLILHEIIREKDFKVWIVAGLGSTVGSMMVGSRVVDYKFLIPLLVAVGNMLVLICGCLFISGSLSGVGAGGLPLFLGWGISCVYCMKKTKKGRVAKKLYR